MWRIYSNPDSHGAAADMWTSTDMLYDFYAKGAEKNARRLEERTRCETDEKEISHSAITGGEL
jgi:hypothetical protein